MENIFAVEFEVNAQNYTDGRFSIPQKVIDVMGLKPGDRTLVEVSSAKGKRSFIVGIKSGNEIYGLQDQGLSS